MPRRYPATCRPFATPRSPGGRMSTARPSVAMSCVAAIRLSATIAAIHATTEPATGASASTVSTSVPASCIGRIHDRLRPTCGHHRRSMTGAHTNLSAHGTVSSDTSPIAPSEYPWVRRITGTACVKKPNGRPCAKYSEPSSVNRASGDVAMLIVLIVLIGASGRSRAAGPVATALPPSAARTSPRCPTGRRRARSRSPRGRLAGRMHRQREAFGRHYLVGR